MDWISVKDRLPDYGMGVLVTDGKVVTCAERAKEYRTIDGYRIIYPWTGHEFGGYEWEFDFDTDSITHWMPLPEPPI